MGLSKLDFNLSCLICKYNSNCNQLHGLFELYRNVRDAASEEINAANILKAIQPIRKFTHNAEIPCQDCCLHTSHIRECLVKNTYYV